MPRQSSTGAEMGSGLRRPSGIERWTRPDRRLPQFRAARDSRRPISAVPCVASTSGRWRELHSWRCPQFLWMANALWITFGPVLSSPRQPGAYPAGKPAQKILQVRPGAPMPPFGPAGVGQATEVHVVMQAVPKAGEKCAAIAHTDCIDVDDRRHEPGKAAGETVIGDVLTAGLALPCDAGPAGPVVEAHRHLRGDRGLRQQLDVSRGRRPLGEPAWRIGRHAPGVGFSPISRAPGSTSGSPQSDPSAPRRAAMPARPAGG